MEVVVRLLYSRISCALVVAALVWLAATPAAAQGTLGNCGSLNNSYGPFDYRVDHARLPIVEAFHFSAQVEQLIRGQTGSIGGDLDYTLRAFPNHHRALLALMRYVDKIKTEFIPGMPYSAECYFVRATVHRPDDTMVRMIYGTYLNARQRKPEALQQLAAARAEAGDSAFTHYNLGLIYLDVGEPGLALEQAHRAIELGFPVTQLKDRLAAAGRWTEPASAPR